MQTKLTPFRSGSRGYALLITMIFVAVLLVIFASMMMWVSTNARINQRNNQFNMSEAAAEAATERVLAPMERDFLSQTLATNASTYATLDPGETNYDGTPWPVQYIFSDANGTTGQISVLHGNPVSVLQPLGSQYANLKGFPWYWTNIATATPVGQPYNVSATVTQIVNFSSIPIFQYAIFYNINLEIDPGQTMFVNGAVWSNQGLWAGTSKLTFNSTVSSVGSNYITSNDPFVSDGSKNDSTAPPNFTLTNPTQPVGGNSPLTMPIAGATNSNPTNVEAILNTPPAAYAMGTAAAYTTNGLEYLANGADLIISNSVNGTNVLGGGYIPTGTNIFIYFQDAQNAPNYLTPITPDFYRLKVPAPGTGYYTNYVSSSAGLDCSTNVSYAGWSFVTNVAFYDYRESDTIQAVQIDVGLFSKWAVTATNNSGFTYSNICVADKGHPIDSIWVYNQILVTSTLLPAVRVFDGIQLPNSYGLSVITPMPLYVYGDYNKQITDPAGIVHVSSGTNTVGTTYPAALMGDAITILSGNWSDTNNASTPLSAAARNASDTTVNAAMLEGIVQSTTSNYSGGVENFLRYLEVWTGNTSTYNGSIVVMFPSIYATNYWIAPGTYYNPPTRNWGFDVNFLQQQNLPPLTPQLKRTVRVSWNAQ
jgi:hypothetical protein